MRASGLPPLRLRSAHRARRLLSALPAHPSPITAEGLVIDNPYTQQPLAAFPLDTLRQVRDKAKTSRRAQQAWAALPLSARSAVVAKGVASMAADKELAQCITAHMGKPLSQAANEIKGAVARSEALLSLAAAALADYEPAPLPGFARRAVKEPVGQVLTLSPWSLFGPARAERQRGAHPAVLAQTTRCSRR